MTDHAPEVDRATGAPFEWWMLSNFAVGAGFSAFIALLIPPYVTSATSDVSASGVVMAIISLGAILGPVLGSFADKYRAHRIVMCAGLAGMALGFGLFAGAAESAALYALDAIILGISIAAISAVAPVFVVGAGLRQELEAKRMTWYSLMMPAGQVAGGVLATAAARAEWSFTARFWLAAAVSALLFVAVLLTSKGPEERIHRAMDEELARRATDAEGEDEAPASIGLKAVLGSAFGLFLLVATLSSVANNGINNQISNILPNLYGISEGGTSTLIAVAGLLNIVLFFPAGKWMARSGPMTVYNAGLIMRLVGALGMALVGWVSGRCGIRRGAGRDSTRPSPDGGRNRHSQRTRGFTGRLGPCSRDWSCSASAGSCWWSPTWGSSAGVSATRRPSRPRTASATRTSGASSSATTAPDRRWSSLRPEPVRHPPQARPRPRRVAGGDGCRRHGAATIRTGALIGALRHPRLGLPRTSRER